MKAGAAKNIPTKFSVFMRGFQNSNSDNFEMKYERKYLIYDVNTFSLTEPFYILAAAISNWNLAQEKKFFFLDEKAHFDQIICNMKKAPTVRDLLNFICAIFCLGSEATMCSSKLFYWQSYRNFSDKCE